MIQPRIEATYVLLQIHTLNECYCWEPAPTYLTPLQDRMVRAEHCTQRLQPAVLTIPQETPTLHLQAKAKLGKANARRGEELNQTTEWVLQSYRSPSGATNLKMSCDKR